jgi:hypothetical protein
MKKLILPGLVTGLAMLIAGMAVSQIFGFLIPSIKTEYENANLFRPWSDPLMSLYFIHPFAVGIILAWVWSMVKDFLTAKSRTAKGISFGLIYWSITLPGMLISYATFPVSFTLVLSWTLSGLAQVICAGLILPKMIK